MLERLLNYIRSSHTGGTTESKNTEVKQQWAYLDGGLFRWRTILEQQVWRYVGWFTDTKDLLACLVWFYGTSTIVGKLMPNPFYTYK